MPTTHEIRRAQDYCRQTVNVPGLRDVVITEEHIAQAESIGITVGQLLDIEPMSPTRDEEIKRKYTQGQPLVEPEEVHKLPTRMYELHQWYTTRKRAIDGIDTNGAPDKWCAISTL